MSKPLSSLRPENFEPLDGESFRLATAGHEIELKLVEVRRLGAALREGGAFSLIFESVPGPSLPQAIYSLVHRALGRLDVFVVPLGPRPNGNQYQVIFT